MPIQKFFDNPAYDEATRTFTGDIDWGVGFGDNVKWECRMVFSQDLTYIESGKIVKKDGNGNVTNDNAEWDEYGLNKI